MTDHIHVSAQAASATVQLGSGVNVVAEPFLSVKTSTVESKLSLLKGPIFVLA
jgi:hypothetical protein